MRVHFSGMAISVNDAARELRGIIQWKTTRNRSLRAYTNSVYPGYEWTMATFTPIAPYFQEPLIASIKRRLRIVILLVFNRFRRRRTRRNVQRRYRVLSTYLSIGDQKRAEAISIHGRASNFPDDKSLWNSSKAWPTTWTSAWRYGRNFSSFHQDVREPLGMAISRPAFSRDDVYCAAYCFHSLWAARDYSILPSQFSLQHYHPNDRYRCLSSHNISSRRV